MKVVTTGLLLAPLAQGLNVSPQQPKGSVNLSKIWIAGRVLPRLEPFSFSLSLQVQACSMNSALIHPKLPKKKRPQWKSSASTRQRVLSESTQPSREATTTPQPRSDTCHESKRSRMPSLQCQTPSVWPIGRLLASSRQVSLLGCGVVVASLEGWVDSDSTL